MSVTVVNQWRFNVIAQDWCAILCDRCTLRHSVELELNHVPYMAIVTQNIWHHRWQRHAGPRLAMLVAQTTTRDLQMLSVT